MKTTKLLRELLGDNKTLAAAGCYDALSARIAEKAGFKVVYLTGFGLTGALLGSPDVNLITMTEITNIASHITDVLRVPLIVDAETGFGGPIQVRRAVREYERAGIAGFHIEDQAFPKKGGSLAGRALVPVDEVVGKIKAALDARQDKDFLVIARTDANDVSFEEAVNRGNTYLEAGADMVMVLPLSSKEVEEFPKAIKGPVMTTMSDHRPWCLIPIKQYEKLGYKMVWFILSQNYVVAKALSELWAHVMKTGSTKALVEAGKMLTLKEFTDLVGLPEMRKFELAHLPKKQLEERYGKNQWGA